MKKLSKTKKIILTILTVVVLVVIGVFVSVPISNKLDQQKFTLLDKSQHEIYNSVVQASKETDKWQYSPQCKQIYTGDWPTGEYTCSTTLFTSKTVTSVDKINELQSKYFSIIDKSGNLIQKSTLNIQSPEDFGKKFVVSSVEKQYKDKLSGVECWYSNTLGQQNGDLNNSLQGSPITN